MATTSAACSMFNECVLTLFQYEGDFDISVTPDDVDTKFSWDAEDGELTLTGLESTWDADATNAADEPDPAH